jgi:leader peptidase (prepilin peptidase)/N-methyltransferase
VLDLMAGAVAGCVGGLATPLIAPRFQAAARAWPYACGGALLGAALGWRLDWPTLWPWLVVLVAGLPLCAIDLAVHRLPDVIVLPATALAALSAWSPRALAGGAVLATGYAVLAVLPRSGLGFGDVKLAGLLGVALAALGRPALVWGTVLAFGLGGVVALALLVTRRARRDTQLPFGPAMLAGALLAALLG